MKIENYDQTLINEIRTRQGAFFTPKLWVDEAHTLTTSVLGENWKDECVVWDCCAGSGNLTREYDFKNLIISTLEQPEVDLLQKQGYTQAFKYDFLNPDDNELFFSENAIPDNIQDLLLKNSDKRLVFFMNPPYAQLEL